ncbi:MAG: DedA family protein [Bdellovibrionaceae bacterium]|nr:DedA family protein [Pseudobdellovibrionaceae bacterium]
MIKDLTTRNEEWRKLKNSNITYAIISLIVFFTTAGFLSLFYADKIKVYTQWIADNFGPQGMCAVVFIADTIISPIPPDAMLLVVAKSQLHENWPLYISLFSFFSVLGGNFGYFIGFMIQRFSWVPAIILNYTSKKHEIVEKFGVWVVVLGALTPLPFSITCWCAGMVRLNWFHFFIASLFRIPRIFGVYYLLIHSQELTDFLSTYL